MERNALLAFQKWAKIVVESQCTDKQKMADGTFQWRKAANNMKGCFQGLEQWESWKATIMLNRSALRWWRRLATGAGGTKPVPGAFQFLVLVVESAPEYNDCWQISCCSGWKPLDEERPDWVTAGQRGTPMFNWFWKYFEKLWLWLSFPNGRAVVAAR